MIVGLNLPNYSGLGHSEAMITIARRTEELHYSSLWASDHVLLPTSLLEPFGNLLESFMTLSSLAAPSRSGWPPESWCSRSAIPCLWQSRRPPCTISVAVA